MGYTVQWITKYVEHTEVEFITFYTNSLVDFDSDSSIIL